MADIRDQVKVGAARFGLDIVDVRIKRVDLPEQNSKSVFDRMRAERQREAAEFRGQGAGEANRIKATADREATVLRAEASSQSAIRKAEGDKQANVMQGEGEASRTISTNSAISESRAPSAVFSRMVAMMPP